MCHYTTYTERDLIPIVKKLCSLHREVTSSHYLSIIKKHDSPHHHHCSTSILAIEPSKLRFDCSQRELGSESKRLSPSNPPPSKMKRDGRESSSTPNRLRDPNPPHHRELLHHKHHDCTNARVNDSNGRDRDRAEGSSGEKELSMIADARLFNATPEPHTAADGLVCASVSVSPSALSRRNVKNAAPPRNTDAIGLDLNTASVENTSSSADSSLIRCLDHMIVGRGLSAEIGVIDSDEDETEGGGIFYHLAVSNNSVPNELFLAQGREEGEDENTDRTPKSRREEQGDHVVQQGQQQPSNTHQHDHYIQQNPSLPHADGGGGREERGEHRRE
jgi:hypothetical protein